MLRANGVAPPASEEKSQPTEEQDETLGDHDTNLSRTMEFSQTSDAEVLFLLVSRFLLY